MERPNVNLGDEARDKVTGYKGIVVCISEWISGCRRISIQTPGLHEGKPIQSQCFDAEQVELVEPEVAKVSKPSGGPHDAPTQHAPASR